jgi:large subunit ribosomal protein L35
MGEGAGGSEREDQESPSPPTGGGESLVLKEDVVPKLKTNRGAAKRFKKTGTGKIKAKKAFARHILTKKSTNRKRGLRRPKLIEKTDSKGIEKLIPYI